jgi:hypothetical protein
MVITTVESIRQSIGDGVRNISQLELELGETSDIPGLTAEIRKLQSAISLFIGSEDVEPQHMSELDWGSDEVIELFQALQTLRTGSCSGGISMMEEIHLQDLGISYGSHGPRFPVALLTTLLTPLQTKKSTHRLKRLVLSVRLWGESREQFDDLADALRQQTELCRVAWEEWCFPPTMTLVDHATARRQ